MSQLPNAAISGLGSLAKSGHAEDVHLFIGDDETQAGDSRTIDRRSLIAAVDRLRPLAKELTGGFQVRTAGLYGDPRDSISRGAGGILIDGIYFGISCHDDHWYVSVNTAIPKGKWLPPEMRGFHRYEPAEIQSENQGLIKIEAKKRGCSELIHVLIEVRAFLEGVSAETVTITIG